MRCRKDYRDLTPAERDRFVQALYHVKANGIVDQYAEEHATHFLHGIHTSSHFLPWHRDFIRRFEDALRAFDPDVTLPYWNSVDDQSESAALWDDAFLGQFDAAWGLNRALGSDTLPSQSDMNNALGQPTYDVFWDDLEVNVHNPPHRWVEGEMADFDSPHDPVFYLHHCWIDLLWAQWQLQNPGAPFVSSGAGLGLNDSMMGVTTTPADVIDHRTINIYHYPAGFIEDAPRVTLDTLAVNFLEVPEGETRMAAAVFSLDACEPLHFTVIAGPTVTSGPAATQFGVLSAMTAADPKIDSKGRLWLTYIGTADGDSATGTVTVQCDETGEQFVIALTANTIARPTAAVVLVLDQSNSMTFDSGIGPGIQREDVLKFSAPAAVDVTEDDHAMAVCSFDHDAHPGIGITSISGGGRLIVNATLSAYAPNPNGWTSIGEGVAFAHGLLDPVTGYNVKAMVVLTDGQENHGPHTRRYISDVADLISGLGGHVFAIGLGRPEVLNASALESLCSGNNGYMMITGDLTPDAYFRMAKYYQQILAGVTNNEIVLDPEGWILPGQKHRIPFWLNETDLTSKAILLTPAPWAIQFMLETPAGDLIDPGVASVHPMASFGAGAQVALYRVGLPIPLGANTAHAGRWHAVLTIDPKHFKKYLGSLDNLPSIHAATASHGIRYSFNVHAYSNLRMKARLVQSSNEPGATLTLRAVLTEYGVPVAARARCRAELTRPDNTTAVLKLSEVDPGAFEAEIFATTPGVYRFRVIAEGATLRGRPFTREQTLTGAVWRGGDRPPPGSKDDPNARDDRLCHLIECVIGQKGVLEALRKAGVDPDALRRCLREFCQKRGPAEPPHGGHMKLEDRLRAVIPDDRVLAYVMAEIGNHAAKE